MVKVAIAAASSSTYPYPANEINALADEPPFADVASEVIDALYNAGPGKHELLLLSREVLPPEA